MRARVQDAGRFARRWRFWSWRMGALVLLLAATACLDDALAPSAHPGVQLDIRAQVDEGSTADARTVTIEVFYRKSDESLTQLRSTPAQVTITPGGSTEQPVVVQLADCLADPQRMGAEVGGCHLVVTLSLLDEGGQQLASETTDIESPVLPGQTISVSPVTLLAVDQVSISGPQGLCVGETDTLTAQAFSGDRTLDGRTFAWSSDHPLVATVDANGLVAAVGAGTATITATTGGVSGTIQITVVLPAAHIAPVSGDGAECAIGVSGDCTFTVRVTDTGGGPAVGVEVLWMNQSSGITFSAYTDSAGLSTAHNLDSATTAGTYTQTATLVKNGEQITFTYQLVNFYGLTVLANPQNNGTGSVTASTEIVPNAFTCGLGVGGATSGTCQNRFAKGTYVTLTATPDSTFFFGGWGGACSSESATCMVSIDSTQTVTASFYLPTY